VGQREVLAVLKSPFQVMAYLPSQSPQGHKGIERKYPETIAFQETAVPWLALAVNLVGVPLVASIPVILKMSRISKSVRQE